MFSNESVMGNSTLSYLYNHTVHNFIEKNCERFVEELHDSMPIAKCGKQLVKVLDRGNIADFIKCLPSNKEEWTPDLQQMALVIEKGKTAKDGKIKVEFFEALKKDIKFFDDWVTFEVVGDDTYFYGLKRLFAGNEYESLGNTVYNFQTIPQSLNEFLQEAYGYRAAESSSGQVLLSSARILSDNSTYSFWDDCCGDIMDINRFLKDVNPMYQFLATIFLVISVYMIDPQQFVLSQMTSNMNSYLKQMYSKTVTLTGFIQFVQKITKLDLAKESVDENNMALISSVLNFDLNFYELKSLQECADFSSFHVSRVGRISPSIAFYEEKEEGKQSKFLSVKNYQPRYDLSHNYGDRFVECDTQYTFPEIHKQSMKIVGEFASMMETVTDALQYHRLDFHQIFLKAIDLIEKTSCVLIEKNGNELNDIRRKNVNVRWVGADTIFTTQSINIQQAQMFVNLLLVSHFREITDYLFPAYDFKSADEVQKFHYEKTEKIYRLSERDLWQKYVELITTRFSTYKLMPIDFEIISQYLEISMVFFHGGRALLTNKKVSVKVNESYFEGGLENIHTSRYWVTDSKIKWIFGKRERDFEGHQNAHQTLFFAMYNKKVCQVAKGVRGSLEYTINPDFVSNPDLEINLDENTDIDMGVLRYNSIADPEFYILSEYAMDEVLKALPFDLQIFENNLSENIGLVVQILVVLKKIDPVTHDEMSDIYKNLQKKLEILDIFGEVYNFPKQIVDTYKDSQKDRFIRNLQSNLQFIPSALLHLIAKIFKIRIVILSYTPIQKIKTPYDIFQFSLRDSFDFDYVNEGDLNHDYYFLRQELQYKADEMTLDEDEDEFLEFEKTNFMRRVYLPFKLP